MNDVTLIAKLRTSFDPSKITKMTGIMLGVAAGATPDVGTGVEDVEMLD